ncbi:CRTAC1 family protein [Edaphobacter sp.]|uniref:CRTAC1 family protein n=1 Tax=Edaphobacter sp. TaxID=1934404 RepID=UPI002DBA04AE|nr:CRTAC1 family protein [Edaphobacter sp.]HEU5340303.1 CRTAC1 family protein [Edaphobacter sp.]
MKTHVRTLIALALLLPGAGVLAQSKGAPPLHFRDIAEQAGLTTMPHFAPVKQYLVEMMGGGVALFDCDNDGKLDIVTVTSSTVERYLHGGDLMVTLYHQDTKPGGTLHFTDITANSGLTTRGWGMGVAVGDYDNDGLPDLYVTGYGHNVLYHNLGGCRFEDVTAQKKVAGGGFSVGAAWADYDRDGKLDLFVSRYVDTDLHHLPKPGDKGFQYQGLPMEVPVLNGETDLLFHNTGAGAFEDLSTKAGVGNPDKRLGMGVVWGDYDHDGWPDLFVNNDMGPNFLYHNKHDGTFEEVGLLSGTALSAEGKTMGNMAADFADYDRNGTLDLAVTRYGYQPMSLYRNEGALGFVDEAYIAGLGRPGAQLVSWGAGFADFGNDGWPDLFVANGNVSSMVDTLPHELKYREPIQLFCSLRNGVFEDVATAAGLNSGPLASRRGTAFGDINNDGNVDVVVYNEDGPPSLFLNETKSANHRVLFKLVGTKSNRAAIGARVAVTAGKLVQIDEVRGGGGYLSSNDRRLHFGLGTEAVMKTVRIEWPSGLVEVLSNVAADNLYTIVEGKGIQETLRLNAPGAGTPSP